MAGPAVVFREVHRLRVFIRDLEDNLDRIPRQRKAHQAKVAKAELTQREELEAIKKLKLTSIDKEKTIKSKQTQLARYDKQVNEVSSKNEYDALQREITHTKEQIASLEDEVLAALLEVDERTGRLPDHERAVLEAKSSLAEFEAGAAKRKESLSSQLDQAKKDLAAYEVNIPADLLPQYNRTIVSLGADGMSVVRSGACTACNTEITRQKGWDLEREMFVVCTSCGRILYLPPEQQS